ncbi:hypothetical protein J5N97_028289 [Dioscorea zingiberensis]|uniref:Uncharacterized protein n=1 Tax=Dioscorea zingiberensis TaxID=325984 RepID=A0A9D5H4R1_9LILI|nr:hypothetical protein J5N97_028289 [Dioscorea zingiberensis]
MPFKRSPALRSLQLGLSDVEELVQVQLTRFPCGSLILGFTTHHLVVDGHATSNFLVAWGLNTHGISIDPFPFHDRSIFATRSRSQFDYEHQGVEFVTKKLGGSSMEDGDQSSGLPGYKMTQIQISVNGPMRLIHPPVLKEYFGNLVLWVFPFVSIEELKCNPLRFIIELIHNEILKVNNDYFQSFIDFSSSKCIIAKGLVPSANMNKSILSPNLEVDSWLRFPFYDLDFGGGYRYYFMLTYIPVEDMLFLLHSFIGDGSIDAFIPLFQLNIHVFKKGCYVLK